PRWRRSSPARRGRGPGTGCGSRRHRTGFTCSTPRPGRLSGSGTAGRCGTGKPPAGRLAPAVDKADRRKADQVAAGKPRIVIVGAGGWTFPAELSRDILAFPSLADGTLVLYDIDVPAAERTASAVRQLAGIAGRTMSIE